MAYTVDDITELVRYHLVAAAPNDGVADGNLVKLLTNVKQMITTFDVDETLYWMVCEDCGAWVSTELIGPDGAGESDDGGFYCTSCRFGEEDS